jgi:hypothetical protein
MLHSCHITSEECLLEHDMAYEEQWQVVAKVGLVWHAGAGALAERCMKTAEDGAYMSKEEERLESTLVAAQSHSCCRSAISAVAFAAEPTELLPCSTCARCTAYRQQRLMLELTSHHHSTSGTLLTLEDEAKRQCCKTNLSDRSLSYQAELRCASHRSDLMGQGWSPATVPCSPLSASWPEVGDEGVSADESSPTVQRLGTECPASSTKTRPARLCQPVPRSDAPQVPFTRRTQCLPEIHLHDTLWNVSQLLVFERVTEAIQTSSGAGQPSTLSDCRELA